MWYKPGLTAGTLRDALASLPADAPVYIEDSYGTAMVAGSCDPRNGSLDIIILDNKATGLRSMLEMVPVESDMHDDEQKAAG